MKQVGVIMSYDSYKEYQEHRKEMYEKGYECMDWIPEGMHTSYIQFIRYRQITDNE